MWLLENIKLHVWLLLLFSTPPGALILVCPFSPRTYSSTPSTLWPHLLFSFSPETALERRGEDRGKAVTGLSFGFSGIGSCHSWLALGILSVIQLTGVYQWAAALGAVGFLQGDFVRVYAKHCLSPRGVLPFSVCSCCDPSKYFLS